MSVYFADLDGYRWQALYSRRRVAAVGRVTIVLVGDQRPRSGARTGIVLRDDRASTTRSSFGPSRKRAAAGADDVDTARKGGRGEDGRVLSDDEVEGFIRDGYVVVRNAFDAATAAQCRTAIWTALTAHDITADDPATWTRPAVRVGCPEGPAFDAIADSPRLVEACDRLIGAGRWRRLDGAGGDVPVRFRSEQWPGDTGYHIEGTWWGGEEYWTSVTSPGRGLTALILFGDVDPDEAPTRLVVGSHRFAAPVLAAAGPLGMGGGAAADRLQPSVLCRQVAHATGRAGDIYLCHPFLVHTSTWPHRGRRPRMMSQPRINAPDGFRLDGSDPSPVAQAIVLGLAPGR